jgi:histidyl-tRNA synthetase
VRGLDYYRHTAFEFVTDRLGAQGTVLGGGRYDGLIETLGGPHTPAVGWAAGIERLAMLVGEKSQSRLDQAIIPVGEEAEMVAAQLLAKTRRWGASAELFNRGNLKKRMQRAADAGAFWAIIIGADELAKGEITIRDMNSGGQFAIPLDDMLHRVENVDGQFIIRNDPNDPTGWTTFGPDPAE